VPQWPESADSGRSRDHDRSGQVDPTQQLTVVIPNAEVRTEFAPMAAIHAPASKPPGSIREWTIAYWDT
jgi:hypothetical protein